MDLVAGADQIPLCCLRCALARVVQARGRGSAVKRSEARVMAKETSSRNCRKREETVLRLLAEDLVANADQSRSVRCLS